jgi:poly(hydroxyalkanoate) granule-associated protein
MVKKISKAADKATSSNLASTVKDSAQQIWLAGLGAFAKAQEEGNKVFEALVKEGVTLQKKTQAVAEERVTEATSKVSAIAENITDRAGHQWDKLETIFEERVGKALNKLGVPTNRDIEALLKRVEELNKSVQKLTMEKKAVAPKAAKPVSKANGSVKPAAKRAASRRASV